MLWLNSLDFVAEVDVNGRDEPDVVDNPVGHVHLAEVPEVVASDQLLAGRSNRILQKSSFFKNKSIEGFKGQGDLVQKFHINFRHSDEGELVRMLARVSQRGC